MTKNRMKNLQGFGIGIDIVNVDKFKRIPYTSHKSFYKKIFNPNEIHYCLKYKNSYERFAGKFAIKEALKKSIADSITPLDIQTYHIKSKPQIKLGKKLPTKYSFLVSVSHEKGFAIAVVISSMI